MASVPRYPQRRLKFHSVQSDLVMSKSSRARAVGYAPQGGSFQVQLSSDQSDLAVVLKVPPTALQKPKPVAVCPATVEVVNVANPFLSRQVRRQALLRV